MKTNQNRSKSTSHKTKLPAISGPTIQPPVQAQQEKYQSTHNRFLPLRFENFLTVPRLHWSDFKGKVDYQSFWLAHIYWGIQYKFINGTKPKLTVNVNLSPRSWVRPECRSSELLNHEHGHLLIGYLCALEFIRRVDNSKVQLSAERVKEIFSMTMKEFLRMEREYDNETEHYLNQDKQEEWDALIRERLLSYKKRFQEKKGKLGKLN